MTDHTTWQVPGQPGERIASLEARVSSLEKTVEAYGETLDGLRNRVYTLEHDTPQARQAQRELDETLADNAAAGYYHDDDYREPRS